jgi:hypothetical protein
LITAIKHFHQKKEEKKRIVLVFQCCTKHGLVMNGMMGQLGLALRHDRTLTKLKKKNKMRNSRIELETLSAFA